MLKECKIDAVVNATPDRFHAEHCDRADSPVGVPRAKNTSETCSEVLYSAFYFRNSFRKSLSLRMT